jgi:uncharacterized protein (TIGR00369 family)
MEPLGIIRMTKEKHFINLENMYLAAPINSIYKPKIEVQKGSSCIEIEVDEKYFHSAGAVHGSVYFKMLDDAAFFAANSLENKVFVLTSSFTTYITRPISSGIIKAMGKVVNKNRSQFIVESVAYNTDGKEIARGNGIFVRGKSPLSEALGYNNIGE